MRHYCGGVCAFLAFRVALIPADQLGGAGFVLFASLVGVFAAGLAAWLLLKPPA